MTSCEKDEELKKAGLCGDVEFLRNCIASNKSMEYYLTVFPSNQTAGGRYHCGNFFHLAAWENREEFMREAIGILPLEVIQQLLLQPRDEDMYNPLHVAANIGNLDTVKLFLDVFKSSPLPCQGKPWLEKTSLGRTPCHIALFFGHETCGLELLKMDTELLCNMVDNRGFSLLHRALVKGLNKVALEILKSPHSFSCSGPGGCCALHVVTNCSDGEDICRLLLEREPMLIKQKSDRGDSVLHFWALEGKLWPIEFILKSNDVIPDVRRVLVDLISATDDFCCCNPLHVLADQAPTNEKDGVQIAKLLIETYKLEVVAQASSISEDLFPWLVHDKKGYTPLDLAIRHRNKNLAVYILSMDNNTLKKCQKNALFLAIVEESDEVAEKILEIIDDKGWIELLTIPEQQNALHLAPLCKNDFCEKLLKRHPELLKGVDKNGNTVLHFWVEIGEVRWLKFLLQSEEVDDKWKRYLVKLVSATNYDLNNPLHIDAASDNEATDEMAKLLVQLFIKETHNWSSFHLSLLPWFKENKDGEGPLHLAISNERETLALYFLSLHDDDDITKVLDLYKPEHNTLFRAIENNCFQVAKKILARLDKESWTKYVMDSTDGRTILHLAPTCTDKDFTRWLVEEAPELITQKDKNGKSPLDEASEVGSASIIQAMFEKDPSAFSCAPLAWVKACEKGHVSTIRAFIDYNPGYFRDICIEHKDSPLHHIQLPKLTRYEEFLNLPRMKDLINLQDSQGMTPLHKAIQNQDILLTETLLNMDKIMYNIKNGKNVTAIDLLEKACEDLPQWEEMCHRIGFDPKIKTAYFQRETNLLEVRNSLFVVAALLATITFTAGFTLPGGFNQDSGEAILANKAAFSAFLVSDALALFFSMLVLICLVWSMVYDSSKSLILIDRSMVLLMLALNCTILAFMTGVYIVIFPKSLWAAILIIVIMSFLIGISVNRTLLYKVLNKLIPSANKERRDSMRLLELGKACLCRGSSSCMKCN